jgi:hypothetical protein
MNAKALTVEQRAQLRRQVEPRRGYLVRLVARMDALGFPAEDPLRVAAVSARDKVGEILEALAAAEPPAPFLAHYGPSEPIVRPAGIPDAGTANLPWVGKRKARRRR